MLKQVFTSLLTFSLFIGTASAERTKKVPECAIFQDEVPPHDANLEVAQRMFAIGVGKWIAKEKRVPSDADLAASLKVTLENLQTFYKIEGQPHNMTELIAKSRELYPYLYRPLHEKLAKAAGRYLKESMQLPSRETLAAIFELPLEQLDLVYGSHDNLIELVRTLASRDYEVAQNKVMKTYARFARETWGVPKAAQMAEALGLNEGEYRALVGQENHPGLLFTSPEEFKANTQERHKKAFEKVLDEDIFNEERMNRMIEAIRNRSRLIVTTAVAGANVNQAFLQALLQYCERNDAEILVFAANMKTTGLDPVLLNTLKVHILTNTIQLNRWFQLHRIRTMAKMMYPTQGRMRNMGHRGQTVVFGSPKIENNVVSTVDNIYAAHRLRTTGAITDAWYAGPKIISDRTDQIAENDHRLSALVLEKSHGNFTALPLQGVGNFHARYVRFNPEQNAFVDLKVKYTPSGAEKARILGFVMGDSHVGVTDPRLLEAVATLLRDLDPEYIVLHDLFDGRSINHHEQKRLIGQMRKADSGELDMEAELDEVAAFVRALLSLNPRMKILIPRANHNDWALQWVVSGEFMNDSRNGRLGLELAKAWMDDQVHPLEYYLRKHVPEYEKRIIFPRSSFKLGGIEVGLHGDKGPGGAKGSLRSYEAGAGPALAGHVHTENEYNDTAFVGTTTMQELDYMKGGLSNWVQSVAAIAETNRFQILTFQDGEWHTKAGLAAPRPEEFFDEGYPQVIPNKLTGLTGQVDQWNQ